MRYLLDQIRKALCVDLYYVSLFTSLTIPDICGAIQSVNGEASGTKYKNWFDTYVAHKYFNMLNGEDCWNFRCSLLHQGTSQHPRSTYKRILFFEPSATTSVFHCNILNDALNIDVRIFCEDIILGALAWLKQNEGTDLYKANYDKFMRRYPNGLSPYISGVPVIG
ncbi:hypothetical protein MCGE09_00036 [Thaumarchaeota archaeon SCGC AB-539-E09]|nr:hypothetical protein MCGE09_00036 [Thaumarchaeota archaeon SCGC AB-539-E09]